MPNDSFSAVHDIKALAADRGWSYRACGAACVQLSFGSRTIPTVAQWLVDRTPEIMNQAGKIRFNSEDSISFSYAKFSTVASYDVPESFVCSIPNALLAGPEGIVITDRNEVIRESIIRKVDGMKLKTAVAHSMPSTAPRVRLGGRCVSLLSYCTDSYAHWMFQTLSRLTQIDPLAPENSDLRFILPPPGKPFQAETLALLGIPESRIIFAEHKQNFVVEELVLSRAENFAFKPNAALLRIARDRMLRAAGCRTAPELSGKRRLYIARPKGMRAVVNESELHPVLRAHGFEIISLDNTPLREQIRLISEAEMLCGPHGAGLFNTIFTRPGSVCIELFNPFYLNSSILRIASMVNCGHWHMFGNDVGNDYELSVDPGILDSLLDTIELFRAAADPSGTD